MRIADQINRGVRVFSGNNGGLVDPNFIRDYIADSQRFMVDNIADWYWGAEQHYWHLETDYGPLRPPYQRMWVEYAFPKWSRIHGEWELSPQGQGAFTVETFDVEQLPDGLSQLVFGTDETPGLESFNADLGSCIISIGQVMETGGRLVLIPVVWIIQLNERGEYVSKWSMFEPGSVERWKPYVEATFVQCNPVLLAIGMLNCRNVSDREVVPPVALAKKSQRKHGQPRVTFRVIDVPGLARTASNPSGPGHSVSALHLVRGHFKTFTDEAPLFGKRTGTYWWGWQTRGNADNGVVVKDYNVTPLRSVNA